MLPMKVGPTSFQKVKLRLAERISMKYYVLSRKVKIATKLFSTLCFLQLSVLHHIEWKLPLHLSKRLNYDLFKQWRSITRLQLRSKNFTANFTSELRRSNNVQQHFLSAFRNVLNQASLNKPTGAFFQRKYFPILCFFRTRKFKLKVL